MKSSCLFQIKYNLRIIFWDATFHEVSFLKDNLLWGQFSRGLIIIEVTLRDDGILYWRAVYQAAIFWGAIFVVRYFPWGHIYLFIYFLFIYLFIFYLFIYLIIYFGRGAGFRKAIFLRCCGFPISLRNYTGWEGETFKEWFQNISFVDLFWIESHLHFFFLSQNWNQTAYVKSKHDKKI